MVGSDVGGISEVIGTDNVVPHGEGFVEAMAEKVATMFSSDIEQVIPSQMDWSKTASAELETILGA